jgi:F5/8 type C domain
VFRSTLLAATALTALTCAYTWPLAAHMASAVPHDRGDPLLVTWILWWSTKAVPLTTAWWNAPAFHPATGVFGFSENLLSLVPIAAPFIVLTRTPLLGYNVLFLLSYVLSGLGAYFLGLVLTARRDAAFVAAIAFAFAPYRLSHLNHLQLLSSYWMPVALGALHLYVRSYRRSFAILFAVAWLLQALASGYYLFFLSLLSVLWLAWFGIRRLTRREWTALGLSWVGAAIVMLPLLLGYRAIHERYGLSRSPAEIEYYSADIAGFVSASADSALWSGLHAVQEIEAEMFPGVTIVLLVAAGWFITARRTHHDRSMLTFYTLTAVLMGLLTLGPHPRWFGRPLGVPGPYALLMYLPGFDEMRVPARLWMLTVLCLSAASALAVAQIQSRTLRRTVVALGVAGLLLDGWPRTFALAAVPDRRPVLTGDAVARLGLPLAQNETETMYRTIEDGLPVFNGYSGYEAPQHPALRDLLDRRDPAILQRLAANGPIHIVVEHGLDSDGSWRRYVEATGAAKLDNGSGWTRFELRPQPMPPPFVPSGSSVPIRRVDATVNQAEINAILDNDLKTRWHSREQRGVEAVTIELGDVHSIRALVLYLGTYTAQYPRSLVVEASEEGTNWTTGWSGRTALMAYDGAIRDPRAVPLAIPLNCRARWLRVRQTAAEATRGWTIVEAQVLE